MEQHIADYLKNVKRLYADGIATEHSYRSHLEKLVKSIVPPINITNEPRRQKCGAPDYVITTKDGIPVGYIEAKDIGEPLDKVEKSHQLKRYTESLDNLILTDYLEFRFFRNGEKVKTIRLTDNEINELKHNFDTFINLIQDFCTFSGQTIKSSVKLAKMMAAKAKLLKDVMEMALKNDEQENDFDSSLKQQMEAFKNILIHDITASDFADIYAQTIAYGMFAARLHDETLDTFSRFEAATLIPKTNPFLRKLFQYIAGYDLDERIDWIIDALANIFRATDVAALLKNFGKQTQQQDPIIHFYETFLAEYDPKLRKSRGVWYTPEPVVKFIVRAVDDILKTEFNLPEGLADTTKTEIEMDSQVVDNRSKTGYKRIKQEIHKVQILDPATGTGTFLAEVIKHIYKDFEGQQGIWNSYAEEHLIPRLNGFELLMASYSMAHLKLDLLLRETGYKPKKDQRFRVYLTNSLEEYHPATGTIFANWLSNEANEANHVKKDTPVMVVLGNPPYSVSSSNKSDWIQGLISDYKKDLNEKKINLDDDYIKFIRFGQNLIDNNEGGGIVAYISNNSFIDGITHRKMRENLLKTFDKIYILDLHGFAKLKEVNLIADNDENVFDIRQGVSINIFIKGINKNNKLLGEIKYFEQYGTRKEKYNFLNINTLESIKWKNIIPKEPHYFYVIKDFSQEENYNKGVKINDIFIDSNSGIKTDRDNLFYDANKSQLINRFQLLLSGNYEKSFTKEFNIEDSGSYKITSVIKNKMFDNNYIQKNMYRPFDSQWTYYDPKIISRPAQKVMSHLKKHSNLGIIVGRQGQVIGHMQWNLVFCTNSLTDYNIFYRGGGYVFPLYKYNAPNVQQSIIETSTRTPNFNMEIVSQIAEKLKLTFIPEKEQSKETFSPIDILDYIYAVLHSPAYREKYKEFLKIDFPRIPYPENKEVFWKLTALGGELRQIHLLESPKVKQYITTYPEDGNNTITRKINKNDFVITDPENKLGQVWINDTQYFNNVPIAAWEFYIGGYQPAQKWLKDRSGRLLSFGELLHYQKIIVALTETERIMKEIDIITEF